MLYPLLLSPAYKDYLWGGVRLRENYRKTGGPGRIAESWELSVHPDGISKIANGKYRGLCLDAYLCGPGRGALGGGLAELPLLVKLIDAADSLSIQVHPDDAYALHSEGRRGKTEFWYIMDCRPGATLLCGLRRGLSREEFTAKARDGTIVEELERIAVSPGDMFLIEPGTVHAIGRDMTVAEVGTNSNITYRIHDFGRLGADGAPRPLHIGQAADVLKKGDGAALGRAARADCGPFSVAVVELSGCRALCAGDTFQCLICVRGACRIGGVAAGAGDTLFVPAGLGEYAVEGDATLLLVMP